jgi:hypothetical protein
MAYRFGGFLEGDGIIWGCYIEDFGLITLGLWTLSFIGLSFLWVVTDGQSVLHWFSRP